jgi:uncharacterized cupin superfamily protein
MLLSVRAEDRRSGEDMERTQPAAWITSLQREARPGDWAALTVQPDDIPCFAIDGSGLERAPASPPRDQLHAPPMRWLKLIDAPSSRITCGVWDCQAGVFDVHFKCDEVVHILEGEVTVRAGDTAQTLAAGDVALFREGLVTTWHVPRYVRKLWFHHFRKPTLRERVEYKLRMWFGLLPPEG